MSGTYNWPPTPLRRRGRRRSVVRWAVLLGLTAIVFVLGVALGEVLDDNPAPAKSPNQTIVRTLAPLPLSAPSTVTVTVTQPP